MSSITLHLDDATQALLEQAAKAHGLSKSRWVAHIIRQHATNAWPPECVALAGRFPDFPLNEASTQTCTHDVPRLDF